MSVHRNFTDIPSTQVDKDKKLVRPCFWLVHSETINMLIVNTKWSSELAVQSNLFSDFISDAT